ncbi:MAG: hypothetical protein M3313_07255 [Actinomycetota bacterium]|nr:hypothetical protein [Actinomycetota bacterium]
MSSRAGQRPVSTLVSRLVVIASCSALGFGPMPHAAAAVDGGAVSADQVVIVGVPGLLWGDVASALAPELSAVAADAALGNMSVRAARSRTCILDGWATLGAGNRARYPAPSEDAEQNLPPLTPEQEAERLALAGCGQQEQVALAGLTDVTRTVRRIAEDEGTQAFGAQPGALGEAVSCSTAIGRSSAVAVSGPTAEVSMIDSLPSDPPQIATALTGCPLSLITVPELIGSVPAVALTEQLPEAGEQPEDGGAPAGQLGRPRPQALAALDAVIGDIRTAVRSLPGETLLLIVGLSEKGISRAQLHPLIALHPELPPGYLTSSSTGRAPYVQLIDVAPTALRALGIEDPASMVGSAMRWAGPSGDIDQALAHLRDLNRAAVAHASITRTFFWILVGLAGALVAGLLMHRFPRRATAGSRSRPPARRLSLAALAFAALPAATHLANLTPWWHSSNRDITLGLAVAAGVALLTVLALGLGSRGPIRKLLPAGMVWAGPAFLVLVATSLTIGLDVLLGSPMELNSLLGYNAIVAGRFVGLGNLSFGLFAAATLLTTAVLVRGPRRRQLLVVAGVGVVAVIIVGAAGLGQDFGGVLALVPGFLVLALLLIGSRLSVRRMVSIGAVTALTVSTFAVLDYQRNPDDRTHLGRFVGQLLDGQAWTVVSRKAQANLDVLTGSPVTWLIPIFGFAAWLLLWRGGRLRQFLAAQPAWRAGLSAAGVSLGIGALINDSGIAVPAIAGCLVVPLLIWLVLGWKLPPSDEPGGGSVVDTPTASTEAVPPRVSVNSREPTG